MDLMMYRKGLNPKKTYYQIEKEKDEQSTESIPEPPKRKRGRPRKHPKPEVSSGN